MKVTFDIDMKQPTETWLWILKSDEGDYTADVGIKCIERLYHKGYQIIKKVRVPAYLQGRLGGPYWHILEHCRSYEELIRYMERILFITEEKTKSSIRNNIAMADLIKLLKKDVKV
jgi:hypothetical protein